MLAIYRRPIGDTSYGGIMFYPGSRRALPFILMASRAGRPGHGGFGPGWGGFGHRGSGHPGFPPWLRDFMPFGGPGPSRRGRGDVRLAILGILASEPMHGYQLIREIANRSDGSWRVSPG